MKHLIAGNWKMHGDFDMAESFDEAMEAAVINHSHVEWVICAPVPYICSITNTKRGAQDCSKHDSGAFTGEVSASMLYDINCDYCIAGHSERRAMHGETNEDVKSKATQIINNHMTAIICVGETLNEREAVEEFKVVESQIIESLPSIANAQNCVIAYEPVWAIGTGRAATADDVLAMHNMIRGLLKSTLDSGAEMRILYGGSVKPSNAAELLNLDNVNGALIGGASLIANDFIAIGAAVKK
jgi:triosephosphate isomerase (TIM)